MPAVAAGFVFTHHDRRRLAAARRRTRDARHCRRLQAVLLVAEGRPVGATAALLKARRRWVTKVVARYRQRRCPDDLAEGRRAGRPPSAPLLSDNLLTTALPADPLAFGYAASGWTAPLLAAHLRALFGPRAAVSVRTLRRRLHAAGLAWKRPRGVFAAREPHRAQKKGALGRALKARSARAVLLAQDETTLRLLPPLRAAWAPRGQQATVPISGRNDQRVLFGALNVATGTG